MKERELLATLAKGIRRARQRLGLTIERLGEAAGIDPGHLAHIETQKKKPSLAALARIVDALKVPPDELFRQRGRTEVFKLDPLDRRLQAALRGLSRSQKADLLAILGKLHDADQFKGLRRLLRA
ncbi:MAG: hypothetical protein COR54_02230 [Elusimicrobia bacterium CG22_combo_CG10-13_8_21_14_all_63_91]|nr:MAG: hypothetical protein COR54_02230 [Elusimicrobia bacterium CG22_combo_CG10-13_8_21_14_all_63_91]PJA14702.1 MAG: hypothetical protein COX66_11855 [Elusimicrobia bacterium CG_4_10_14_0_2_um_filter_63_34]